MGLFDSLDEDAVALVDPRVEEIKERFEAFKKSHGPHVNIHTADFKAFYASICSEAEPLTALQASSLWRTLLSHDRPVIVTLLADYVANANIDFIIAEDWRKVLEFLAVIDDKLETYREDDNWPFVLDEFVDHARKELSLPGRSSNARPKAHREGPVKGVDRPVTLTAKNESGFSGLSNQGATCYMNSILQAFFMTPEFRVNMFAWRYRPSPSSSSSSSSSDVAVTTTATTTATTTTTTSATAVTTTTNSPTRSTGSQSTCDPPQAECIPFQLQELFARMHVENGRSHSTKGLTRSFGWQEADAFRQHDVQELACTLLDVLETTMAGTPQGSFVKDNFGGRLKDYIRCKVCGKESYRIDTFLDLSVEVRGVTSLQDGLANYVRPEVLDGDNAYFCAVCSKKVAALKGLAILELPRLLMIHLKRFTFDWTSGDRVKLNHEVAFPTLLNAAPYLSRLEDVADETSARVFGVEAQKGINQGSGGTKTAGPPESGEAGRLRATLARFQELLSANPSDPLAQYWASIIEEKKVRLAEIEGGASRKGPTGEGSLSERGGSLSLGAAGGAVSPPFSSGGEVARTALPAPLPSLAPSGSGAETGGGGGGGGRGDEGGRAGESGRVTNAQSDLPPIPTTTTASTASSLPPPPQLPSSSASSTASGPLYELYGILVHTGVAHGGHYYAVLQHWESGEWFEFNDDRVFKVSVESLSTYFGAKSGQLTRSGASAYYLLYRQKGSGGSGLKTADMTGALPDYVMSALAATARLSSSSSGGRSAVQQDGEFRGSHEGAAGGGQEDSDEMSSEVIYMSSDSDDDGGARRRGQQRGGSAFNGEPDQEDEEGDEWGESDDGGGSHHEKNGREQNRQKKTGNAYGGIASPSRAKVALEYYEGDRALTITVLCEEERNAYGCLLRLRFHAAAKDQQALFPLLMDSSLTEENVRLREVVFNGQPGRVVSDLLDTRASLLLLEVALPLPFPHESQKMVRVVQFHGSQPIERVLYLPLDATLGDLRCSIFSVTGIAPGQQRLVKYDTAIVNADEDELFMGPTSVFAQESYRVYVEEEENEAYARSNHTRDGKLSPLVEQLRRTREGEPPHASSSFSTAYASPPPSSQGKAGSHTAAGEREGGHSGGAGGGGYAPPPLGLPLAAFRVTASSKSGSGASSSSSSGGGGAEGGQGRPRETGISIRKPSPM